MVLPWFADADYVEGDVQEGVIRRPGWEIGRMERRTDRKEEVKSELFVTITPIQSWVSSDSHSDAQSAAWRKQAESKRCSKTKLMAVKSIKAARRRRPARTDEVEGDGDGGRLPEGVRCSRED